MWAFVIISTLIFPEVLLICRSICSKTNTPNGYECYTTSAVKFYGIVSVPMVVPQLLMRTSAKLKAREIKNRCPVTEYPCSSFDAVQVFATSSALASLPPLGSFRKTFSVLLLLWLVLNTIIKCVRTGMVDPLKIFWVLTNSTYLGNKSY